MMAGAYTLAKNGHVRGDVLYGFFRPRTQATLDLILYFLFFLPGVVALTWAGWNFANESLAIRESTFSATPLPVYPFKFIIPLAGGMLLLQGVVEIVRCIQCIQHRRMAIARARRGRGRRRQAQGHGARRRTISDIAALDKFVAPKGGARVKIRKELWFGFILMALIIAGTGRDAVDGTASIDQRPPGPDDAGAGGGGHHAGLSRPRSR